jgi:hypothetical protein
LRKYWRSRPLVFVGVNAMAVVVDADRCAAVCTAHSPQQYAAGQVNRAPVR